MRTTPTLTLTTPAAGRSVATEFVARSVEWHVDVLPGSKPRAQVTVRGKDDELEEAGTSRFATITHDGQWWYIAWPAGLFPPVSFVMAAEEFLEEFAPVARKATPAPIDPTPTTPTSTISTGA